MDKNSGKIKLLPYRRLSHFNIPFFILLLSCAYFNTFYNAQNYFNEAKKTVQNDTLTYSSELFDKTIEKAAAVIVKYPNSRYVDDAIFMMGVSYYYKGDYPRAIERLEFFLENYPGSKWYNEAKYFQGLAYYKSDRLNKAIIAFNELMDSKKFKKKAGIMLLASYYKDRNFEALDRIAEQLLKERLTRKERLAFLKILGEAQYDLKKYDRALETYNMILKLTSLPEEKRDLKLKIARIYLDIDKFDECAKFLAGEDDPEFKFILAHLNTKMNDIPSAKEIYLELLDSKQPEHIARAYYELGELSEKEDSIEQAIAYYDSSANRPGGQYSLLAKKRSDILKKINSLVSDTTDIARARFLLAETYYTEIKDIPKALILYDSVYQNFPKSIWGPKALYARFWITKNILKDDSLSQLLAEKIFKEYSNTEYAQSVRNILTQEEK